MKGKLTAVLIILIFIVIAALVFTVLSTVDKRLASTPEPSPVVTAAPQTTPYTVPTPIPATAAPVATPEPVVTPAPTPVPTPVPVASPTPLPTTAPTTVPVQTTLTSGSFSSDTGTWLNITADWSVTALDQNRVQVTVSVAATSFALETAALPRTINISLDGQYVSLDAPAIYYDGHDQVVSPLGTTNFTVELPANSSKVLALQVEWQFNGEMGGPNGRMQLPVIECGGSISVSR